MKGDRENCLAAGMDSYVTKPIQVQELFDAMAEVMRLAPARAAPAPEAPLEPADFDRAEAIGRVGGDAQLLRELGEVFLGELPAWLAGLEQALHAGDAGTVQRLAHTIKGAVGTFGATRAAQAAQRLEQLGREEDLAAG